MGKKKKLGWLVSSILLALIVGIVLGYIISGKSFGRKLFFSPNNKINVILDVINEDYVDAINMKDLTENAISNIIGELDPHSLYISSKDLQTINEDMDGHFGGIGIELIHHRDTLVIVSVTRGGPSEQAGLLSGDRIVSINDSLFVGPNISEEKLMTIFRKAINVKVKLGIKRISSDDILSFDIVPDDISVSSIKAAYPVAKGIGLIKIYDRFSHTTHKDFINAIAQLMAQGCTSFIIDLRMNGGGAMDAAINIANELLPEGRMIVYTEGKAFPRQETKANGSGICQGNQLVILMDQTSASASEIVAGAIQDNDRGLIIGRRSFGKGLVQNQIELSDGSAVRLTIARYFTPSGRNIQRKYELGKTNEYNQKWIDQLNHGESFYEDSVHLDKALEYNTLYGRTVYGGGGIMPDLFVAFDTSALTTYYIKLDNCGIFNQFAFDYADINREKLKGFRDYHDMLEYLETQPILNEIVRYAELNGIKRRSNLIAKSSNHILNTTYACIIRNFFGDE
ncbi:MAG: PDZ domain-containing protein, partial [Tannerella sp.]|nr:PDZ domain-containing protein [Tannerella sp.]